MLIFVFRSLFPHPHFQKVMSTSIKTYILIFSRVNTYQRGAGGTPVVNIKVLTVRRVRWRLVFIDTFSVRAQK